MPTAYPTFKGRAVKDFGPDNYSKVNPCLPVPVPLYSDPSQVGDGTDWPIKLNRIEQFDLWFNAKKIGINTGYGNGVATPNDGIIIRQSQLISFEGWTCNFNGAPGIESASLEFSLSNFADGIGGFWPLLIYTDSQGGYGYATIAGFGDPSGTISLYGKTCTIYGPPSAPGYGDVQITIDTRWT